MEIFFLWVLNIGIRSLPDIFSVCVVGRGGGGGG